MNALLDAWNTLVRLAEANPAQTAVLISLLVVIALVLIWLFVEIVLLGKGK